MKFLEGETMWFIASDFLDRMFEKSGMNAKDFRAFIQNMNYNQNHGSLDNNQTW